MGRIQRQMCAGMLGLQAVVLFLTVPVMLSLTDVSTGTGLGLGLGLAVCCVVAAGGMRARWGGWLGWAVQVGSIALGVLVAAMFVLGVLFLALYAGAWFVGVKIDRERLERSQV